MRNRILQIVALTVFGGLAWSGRAAEPGDAGRPAFGFAGPEIFPIDNFISELRAADLDGDGLTDLVVVNNARSKISLLWNQTGKTNPAPASTQSKPEINELPPDARFRLDSIASEKRIAALVVADLNSDHRPDFAYYGDPKELIVQYHQGSNAWSAPKRWPIEDGQLTPNALSAGDLNGDGRADLVLLGENAIYFLAQNKDRGLDEPVKIPFSGALKSVQVLDINGDGREDLMLVNWDNPNPFRFRLQNASGQLGPEVHFSLPPIRSYTAEDLDGDRKTELVTIAMNSGRAQVARFARHPAEPLAGQFRQGQFEVLPLSKTSKPSRGATWGDINADDRPDLLVAEPDSGQLSVYLQRPDGSLSEAKTFPSLTGVSTLAVVAGKPGQPADLYLMSSEEQRVGVTRYTPEGRVPFPSFLPMDGKPLALAAGPLRAGAPASLGVVLDQTPRRVLHLRGPDGQVRTQKLSDSFKASQCWLALHDVDHDGLVDALILQEYEKVKILRQVEGKDFEELDVAPPGGAMEKPWFSLADVDGDGRNELLLPQKSFLRAVVLKAEPAAQGETNPTWTFAVKDQINGASLSSRLVGAAPLRNGTNALASLFLLDAERKALTLCERDRQGVWQIVRNLPLAFSEFQALRPTALGSKEDNAITFLGANAVGWMRLDGEAWQFAELGGYETPIKEGRLHDVIPGDLNQDGRKDLVFIETAKNYLDLVIFDAAKQLVPATRWQVFEQRAFRQRTGDLNEPREALITDVTGDKKNDLVVVVHDRIVVYPQE